MGGSLVGLGGLTIESAQIPRYGRFSRPTWMAQPLTVARNLGYGDTTVAYLISSGESHDLPPAISRRVPSELPDPFGESSNELLASPIASSNPWPVPKLDIRSMSNL
ncbi:hypothetical protein BHM03_00032850 [Ensete ventricosum]|nr:hypothetical protein BHM03_00032850 [Ensete ventricosum]